MSRRLQNVVSGARIRNSVDCDKSGRGRLMVLSRIFGRVAMVGALLAGVVALSAPPAVAASPTYRYRHLCGPVRAHFDRCNAVQRLTVNDSGGITPNYGYEGYRPAEIEKAYSLPSLTAGTGDTVAIVDAFDAPNAEADLGVYRGNYGLPSCTTANGCFRKINQTGGTVYPPYDANWEAEISLDLDMVSASCPLCKILLVEATTASSVDLGTAVNEAVASGANAVSNSYGGPEFSTESSEAASYYNHPGVALIASAGDSGFGPQQPAAFSTVTAVGGTTLYYAFTARGFVEAAWSGTGSGCSQYIAKPSWQHDTGCTKRTIADVSAVADPNIGVSAYDSNNFGFGVYGGTSAAAPIIAAAYAMTGRTSVINDSSSPWLNHKAFYDVTSGNNGTCSPTYLCTSGIGYDGPTGWGSPNGINGLIGGVSITSLNPSSLPHPSTNKPDTATGGNFVSGDKVTFSGTGVSATVVYVNPTTLNLTVSVSTTAATGPRNVTVTHPGGATANCVGCFNVT